MNEKGPEVEPAGTVCSRQRLVICFDGTWNNRDSSTNVFHIHKFVQEGLVAMDAGGNAIHQWRHYDEGVGTGVLDGVSGGAFGLGLEQNVREAYNWLIEHYRDPAEGGRYDEVYIFGFSRGAYTARSLVGFIMRCGLLKPGAPLTVTQLWKTYTEFGEYHAGVRREPPHREISALKRDPWKGGEHRDLDSPILDEERLLREWSRRIPIHFLGIFDTVGAMGWDALAIPGLRSRLGVMHNMRLSSIIRRCYHAMAVDEHRSSFVLTPLLWYDDYRFVGGSRSGLKRSRYLEQRWFLGAHSNIGGGYKDNLLAARPLEWILRGAERSGLKLEGARPGPPALPKPAATQVRDSYVEFTGGAWSYLIRAKRHYRRLDPPRDVHGPPGKWNAEVEGAGYALHFVKAEVDDSALALAVQEKGYAPPNVVSYAERELERHALRSQQAAEEQAREDAAREAEKPVAKKTGKKAARKKARKAGKKTAKKVAKNARKAARKTARKAVVRKPEPERDEEARRAEERLAHLRVLAARTPVHEWLPTWAERGWFVIWCIFAVAGIAAIPVVFGLGTGVSCVVLLLAAVLLPVVDWGESRCNFSLARRPDDVHAGWRPWRRGLYDVLMSIRGFSLVFVVVGFVAALVRFGVAGLEAATGPESVIEAWRVVAGAWWPVVVLAAVMTAGLAFLSDRHPALQVTPEKRRSRMVCGVLAVGAAVVLLGLGGLIASGVLAWLARVLGLDWERPAGATGGLNFGGALLLMHVALLAIRQAFIFVRHPMGNQQLGSILPLLRASTPEEVREVFATWRRKLTPHGQPEVGEPNPADRVRRVVGLALWRDLFGLIPVYAIGLALGLWVGAAELGWSFLCWPQCLVPLWLLIPLVAALADAVENLFHLSFLRRFAAGGEPPGWQVFLGRGATNLKMVAFGGAALGFLAIWVQATWAIFFCVSDLGWRGLLAGLGSVLILAASVAYAVRIVAMRGKRKAASRDEGTGRGPA